MKILSFGDIIWDVYPDKACIGGALLNFSAHVKKSGAESYLMSAVGDDPLGEDALEKLKKFGVDTRYVGVDESHATGQCRVTLDENAIPTFCLLDDVAYDHIVLDEDALEESFDAIAFGSVPIRHEKNADTLMRLIKNKKAGKVYCDVNLRTPFFTKETTDFCLRNTEILKVSETELEYAVKELLSKDAADYQESLEILADAYKNLELILLTCGEEGAYAYLTREKVTHFCPSKKVEVVSTVGAGDSFGAAFLVNYLCGKDIPYCLRVATERAAYVVSHIDAVPE